MTPLILSALSIGFLHTLTGPDHYIPFVAMSRARAWSLPRTILITLACGAGHVGSSVALAFVGVGCGIAVSKQLEAFDTIRGNIAAWLLITFGLLYTAYGIRRHGRAHRHAHWHAHSDGTLHTHRHVHHESEHLHVHENTNPHAAGPSPEGAKNLTPWILFTIFLFGPCEPLIPLVMVAAAQGGTHAVIVMTAVFGLVTLVTMTAMVVAMTYGAAMIRIGKLGEYGHVFAGIVVFACGVAVKCGL